MTRKKQPEIRDADEVIRDYYESGESAREGAFRRDGTEPVSSTSDPRVGDSARSHELSGGDVDAAPDQADGGAESVGGSNPTPDQDIVEDLGKAVGVTYEDAEPLKFGDKVAERDLRRWEMDPASSEDYQSRTADKEPASPPPSEPGHGPGASESTSAATGAPRRRKSASGKKRRS